MARESAKRRERGGSVRPAKASASIIRARGPVSERGERGERGPDSQSDLPESQRAPGRGKYDRTRSPDDRQKDQIEGRQSRHVIDRRINGQGDAREDLGIAL